MTKGFFQRGYIRGNLLSLLEQLILSTTNFMLIIVLARLANSIVVGKIAVMINIMTLFIFAHKSFSNAFTVFVSGENNDVKKEMLHEYIVLHMPIFMIAGICFIAVPILIVTVEGSAISIILIGTTLVVINLVYEAKRRIWWAFEEGHKAVYLAILRLLVFGLVLFLLRTLDLTISFLVSLLWMLSTRIISIPFIIKDWLSVRGGTSRIKKVYLKSYWNFSKWLLLRGLLSYLSGNVYIPIVALLLGSAKTGEFEIGRQLLSPFYLVPIGLSSFLLPKLSKEYKTEERAKHKKNSVKLLVLWSIFFSILSILLAIYGQKVLVALVGEKSYLNNFSNDFIILAILGFSISLNIYSEINISAIEKPQLGWRPMGYATITNAIVGIPFVLAFGVTGAFAGNALTLTIATILVLKAFFRSLKLS